MVAGQDRSLGTEGTVTALELLPTVCIYPLSMPGIAVLFWKLASRVMTHPSEVTHPSDGALK